MTRNAGSWARDYDFQESILELGNLRSEEWMNTRMNLSFTNDPRLN